MFFFFFFFFGGGGYAGGYNFYPGWTLQSQRTLFYCKVFDVVNWIFKSFYLSMNSISLVEHILLKIYPTRSRITYRINTLRSRPNGRHFADDIFKRIFLNEKVQVFIQTSLKFVPKGPMNYKSTLVQIIARRGSGDKPLSEPMVVYPPGLSYSRIYASRICASANQPPLVQIMACRLAGAKPLSEPVLEYC